MQEKYFFIRWGRIIPFFYQAKPKKKHIKNGNIACLLFSIESHHAPSKTSKRSFQTANV